MSESRFRELLRQKIVSIPPPKIQAVMGPPWRNTLILHEGEIDVIWERIKEELDREKRT